MSNRSSRFPVLACRRPSWLIWIPVLMVAAMLYWTVALGLGGLSLMAVSALSGGTQLGDDDADEIQMPEGSPGAITGTRSDEPIVVHLEESAEPEDVEDVNDVNDNAGAASSSAADDPAALPTPGPGATAF